MVPTCEEVDVGTVACGVVVRGGHAEVRERRKELQKELPLNVGDAWEAVVNVHVVGGPALGSTGDFEGPEVDKGEIELTRELVHKSGVERAVITIAKRIVFDMTRVAAGRRGHDTGADTAD